MSNSRKKIIFIVLAVIALAVILFWIFGNKEEETIVLETVKVENGNISKIVTATGTVEPLTEVEVGTQVSGEVEKIYVDFNSKVKKGQLIAEIDKTNLRSALKQARATYQNRLNEKNYNELIYQRQKALFDEDVISKSDFEEAEFNYNTAKISVDQALSDLEEAQTNLGYADIYSPIDGVVLSREVDEGQTVAASFEAPVLFTIAKDLVDMQVEADVDEADIGEVIEGQNVSFTVDAFPDSTFDGKVTQVRLNPTDEDNVITYKVVIEAENKDLKLKPGMTATVSIKTLEINDVLTIQTKAINFTPDMPLVEKYNQEQGASTSSIISAPEISDRNPFQDSLRVIVWKFENGKIVPISITTGASDGIYTQIVSGAELGDNLVYQLSVNQGKAPSMSREESPFMPKPPGRNSDKEKAGDE